MLRGGLGRTSGTIAPGRASGTVAPRMAPDMVALERVSGTVFPTFKEVCMAPAWEAWGGLKRPGEGVS